MPSYAARVALISGAALLSLLLGCAAQPAANPSFPVTVDQARDALADMRAEPKPLARPLVILGGMGDPGFAAGSVRGDFRKLTSDPRVLGVSFPLCGDFDACRRRAIKLVDEAFPTDDPAFTTEVDVIGISMGGLVARYAAAPSADPSRRGERRLRIARLFTISTPHRGAAWAALPTVNQLHRAMRGDSPFLRTLADVESLVETLEEGYAIYPYVRLGDGVVGAWNAAPHGRSPWWVPGQVLQEGHAMASRDARILADVARRLRGEEPLTRDPPEPLPPSDVGPAPLSGPPQSAFSDGPAAADTARKRAG